MGDELYLIGLACPKCGAEGVDETGRGYYKLEVTVSAGELVYGPAEMIELDEFARYHCAGGCGYESWSINDFSVYFKEEL